MISTVRDWMEDREIHRIDRTDVSYNIDRSNTLAIDTRRNLSSTIKIVWNDTCVSYDRRVPSLRNIPFETTDFAYATCNTYANKFSLVREGL